MGRYESIKYSDKLRDFFTTRKIRVFKLKAYSWFSDPHLTNFDQYLKKYNLGRLMMIEPWILESEFEVLNGQ